LKKLIERIGIDRLVISCFRIMRINFEKLKTRRNVVVEYQEQAGYLLADGACFSRLKIEDNVQFGTLTAGIKKTRYGEQDYAFMDITIGDAETGNLQNTTIQEYKERVVRIFGYLKETYGMEIEKEETRISKMEINTTFHLDKPFYQYHRALRLMMFNLPDYYKKISEVKKKNKQYMRLESETFYRGNKSMQIKIYDKKRQIEYKTGTKLEAELMRIEFVLLTAQKVRESFGTNQLWDITDEQIDKYYITQFRKLFERRYDLWKVDNQKRLRSMVIAHKKENRNMWQRNLLNECRNLEQNNQVPFLLDIQDLLEQVQVLEKKGHFSRIKKGILQKCEPEDVYLREDAKKIEEIFDKVNRLYESNTKQES